MRWFSAVCFLPLVLSSPLVSDCIGRCDDHSSPYINTTTSETRMQYMMRRMEEDFNRMTNQNNMENQARNYDIVGKKVECVNGKAGEYPCNKVDLLSVLSHQTMRSKGARGNDIWGWTDPETSREYAIVCQVDGTAFVDVTDPIRPIIKGRLPTKTYSSSWRDAKVYKDHAFIVSEAGSHGVQVFDLTQLRSPAENVTFKETAYFADTGRCHNIVINEESATAFCVGSQNVCRGGLYMMDISNPKKPTFQACFKEDGYVHDAQCVIYRGPDVKYQGKEVCFCYNEDTLTIVDITQRTSMRIISRSAYKGSAYTHQGWLTEDQSFLLADDELDEEQNTNKNNGITTTYIWDVKSLEYPKQTAYHLSPTTSIDHNLYIQGDLAYMSNYCSGLRVVNVKNIEKGAKTQEFGYFDVRPEDDAVAFFGTWSNYPYFKSGNIIVNSIERGLFVLRVHDE